jgi:3-dehydroquinate synthase II
MKLFWVKAIPWNKKAVTAALEAGADAVMVEDQYTDKVKELGLIKTISNQGDLIPEKDVFFVEITSKEDEERALELSKRGIVVVDAKDWKIIPLENLVAQSDNIVAVVRSKEEAETAIVVLEKGTLGVLLDSQDPAIIKEVGSAVKRRSQKLPLVEAEILEIRPAGMGYRCCIDTTDLMDIGEGMLVGDKSDFLFLVHSESIENPYVSPRPFRVNAGGVHAYILCPNNKTKYLCEITSGDTVLVVDKEGKAREAVVGRNKTEVRPLLLVKARYQDKTGTLILQNAETIRLTSPTGEPVSVVKLKKGDKVLAYCTEAGRHFGVQVKEKIKEL